MSQSLEDAISRLKKELSKVADLPPAPNKSLDEKLQELDYEVEELKKLRNYLIGQTDINEGERFRFEVKRRHLEAEIERLGGIITTTKVS